MFMSESAGEWNEFLDRLQYEHWRPESGFSMAIQKTPSLNYLQVVKGSNGQIKYSINDVFRRSFYWYSGSMTTPPCTEGVQRYVFSEPIGIPSMQLRHFKEKVFNTEIHFIGNSKSLKSSNGRNVYYHEDTGTKCAKSEEMDFSWLDDKEDYSSKKSSYIDLSKFKPSYIKATTKTTTYGLTHDDLPSNMDEISKLSHDSGARQSIELSNVNAEEVPFDVKSRLSRKYHSTAWEIRNGKFHGDLDKAIRT